MSSKVKTIQEAIENRARERAKEKVQKLIDFLKKEDYLDCKPLRELDVVYAIVADEGKTTNLRSGLCHLDRPLSKQMVDYYFDKFLPEEVARYSDEVTELKNKVGRLTHELEVARGE